MLGTLSDRLAADFWILSVGTTTKKVSGELNFLNRPDLVSSTHRCKKRFLRFFLFWSCFYVFNVFLFFKRFFI